MPHTIYLGTRSLFITSTAWVFIVLGLAASTSAFLQHAQLMSLPAPLQGHPQLSWVLLAALAMSLVTVASAVGLLLRLEGARRAFIGVLALAIVANVAGLALQAVWVQSLVDTAVILAAVPAQVLACGVLGWIIHSLMSPGVKQQFA
jgi:hypothetical protein